MKNEIKELNLNEMENVNGGIVITAITLSLIAVATAVTVYECIENA